MHVAMLCNTPCSNNQIQLQCPSTGVQQNMHYTVGCHAPEHECSNLNPSLAVVCVQRTMACDSELTINLRLTLNHMPSYDALGRGGVVLHSMARRARALRFSVCTVDAVHMYIHSSPAARVARGIPPSIASCATFVHWDRLATTMAFAISGGPLWGWPCMLISVAMKGGGGGYHMWRGVCVRLG